jgi:hypothetical protein
MRVRVIDTNAPAFDRERLWRQLEAGDERSVLGYVNYLLF